MRKLTSCFTNGILSSLLEKSGTKLDQYGEAQGLLSKEQFGFHRCRLITEILSVVRRVRRLKRKMHPSCCSCASSACITSVTPSITFSCSIFSRLGVPPWMIAVIRQRHHTGMRPCAVVRGDAGSAPRMCAKYHFGSWAPLM